MKRTVQQNFRKKLLLSLVAIVGIATYKASAQEGPAMFLGVNLGPQYTSIISNSQNFTGGIGYNAALSAELRLSKSFGIEGQFGLSTLSASTKYKDSIIYNGDAMRYDNNYTFNTVWLQGHLLAKYYIRLGTDPITPYDRPEGSGNYLYFLAGGYGSFMPKGLGKVGRTGTQTTQQHINFTPQDSGVKVTTTYNDNATQEAADKNVINNVDYGVSIGTGVSLRLSSSANLDFGFRVDYGLNTIDNPIKSLTNLDPNTNSTDLISNGFFLGHNEIVLDSKGAHFVYTPAQATNIFISFNIGLKFKLFGDSY